MDEIPNNEIISIEDNFSNIQVFDQKLPRLAILEYSPLEKNLLKGNIIWIVIFLSIAAIVISVLKYVIELEWMMSYGHYLYFGILALFLISIVLIYFQFHKKSYALRQKDIIYNSGLFWKSSIVIPFNRVQHCEVSQGPIDRMLNLSELKIFTAGGSSSDLSIQGLLPDTANRIKDFIIVKTGLDEEE